jgi:quercetin dioxygenase-like cupin family protein
LEADLKSLPYEAVKIAGSETIMEGADMRVTVLTLAETECIPWHYHSEITDSFVCLEGPMVVETRAPRAEYVLGPGERCEVPPKVAHYVHGLNDGPFKFLIIQGVGVYDNIAVQSGRDG